MKEARKPGEGCGGCIHYRKFNSYVSWKTCNYIFDTGMSRGCEGGTECKYYSTDKGELKKILKKEQEDESFA